MANKDNSPEFRSITGQGETSEPANNGATRKPPVAPKPHSSTHSASAIPQLPTSRKSSSINLTAQASSPLAQSPRTSRNTSPIRKDKPQMTPNTTPSAAAIQRALSASNITPSQPQASTVSEAVSRLPRGQKVGNMSGESTPQWPISPRLRSPPPSGSNSRRGSNAAPKKPESPATPSIQVLSATPQNNSPALPTNRQASSDVHRSDPQLQAPPPAKNLSRGPSGKSMLETVQENGSDAQEPSPAALQAAADLKPLTKLSGEDKSPSRDLKTEEQKPIESGSESASNKSDSAINQRGRQSSAANSAAQAQQPRPRNASSKNSYAMSSTRSKQGDGKQAMTVETETVQSIPQSGLAPASEQANRLRAENNGTVKMKTSNETIRPKKERKKAERKTRSVNQGTGMYYTMHSPSHQRYPLQGYRYFSARDALRSLQERELNEKLSSSSTGRTASSLLSQIWRAFSFFKSNRGSADIRLRTRSSFTRSRSNLFRIFSDNARLKATSKADLFEARVANAVDEANTSDSDETFVYESNPPEPQRRQRHHSRTPSVTSSHSIADQQRSVLRNFGDPFDDRRIGGKRSMKFSSNPYQDVDSPESKDGTVRSHTPRHKGRFSRAGHHSATYDHQDSPFTQASKIRQSNLQRSRPTSPRSPQSTQFRSGGFFSSVNRNQARPYDFDTEQNADDERTPLVGTVRTNRAPRAIRRINSHLAYSADPYATEDGQWRCGRIGSCLLTMLVIILVLVSAGIFIFASNRTLAHVEIHKIQNVLATEEELIMDLVVGAVNPNAWDITISDMDLLIFAKSKYVSNHVDTIQVSPTTRKRDMRARSIAEKNPNPSQDLSGHWHAPSDYQDDPGLEKETITMYIGRTTHFDQGISFEASPLKQHRHSASGQVRLMKPGNKTETGGSARWEKIVENPFELVVRGVLKYALPISARQQTVAVAANITVHPEDGVDDKGNMRTVPTDHSDHWQWIDWSDLMDDNDAELVKDRIIEEIE